MSTGCFDLNYKDTQEYYDLFSDTVYLFYADEEGTSSTQVTKSLKDELFNDDTANDVKKVKTIDELLKIYEDKEEITLTRNTADATSRRFVITI